MNTGRVIYGFCNGFFGRDDYDDKRIEAEGIDWIVARPIDSSSASPTFAYFDSETEKLSKIAEWATPRGGE